MVKIMKVCVFDIRLQRICIFIFIHPIVEIAPNRFFMDLANHIATFLCSVRLENELEFILTQQQELEDILTPLEESVRSQGRSTLTQHADQERERTSDTKIY